MAVVETVGPATEEEIETWRHWASQGGTRFDSFAVTTLFARLDEARSELERARQFVVKNDPAGPVLMSPEDPEPCSCDEALALRAELATLRTELARTRFLSLVRGRLCDAWSKMLDAKRAESSDWKAAAIANANVTLALREELAEAQGKLARLEALLEADHLHGQLVKTRAELAEANNRWHSACDVGRRLEFHLEARIGELRGELDEAKRAAETWEELCRGQEVLGKQADALVEKFQGLATEAAAKMSAMEVSMNAAYTERNRLVAFLARICKPTAGIRRTPIEGWNPEWTNCVFVDTTEGQMSWHYHDSDAHLFASLPAYEKPWDGHTTAEKYERLSRLTELTAALT